jgi:K+-sensing histidine kinase KdpD
MTRRPPPVDTHLVAGAVAAIAAPALLTALLLKIGSGQPRDYVFLYLGVVAALGVTRGLLTALISAASSFLLVDYYLVPPVHTLSLANRTDLVNLIVFVVAAGLVGGLGSRRRRAQLESEALTTRLQAVNEELARLNREQAEAAALAVRLAQMQQQVQVLQETDRVRRDFLANVSHELRTPLGSLLTGSTGLAVREDLPDDARSELGSMSVEARRLARLVGDMLDMTRIEGNALDLRLENVDIGDAVVAAIDRLHRTSPARRLDWEPAAGHLTVLADWDRLAQVLDNLLGNADRLAPPDTPITVASAAGNRSMIVLRVGDRGPGIPAEIRDRIFERFVRSPTADADGLPGTGLGLAIVRGLVEAQGGRIWLEDQPAGQGACFAFTLPAAAP